MKPITTTMQACTTHIYAQDWDMINKCLAFMKNWNATLGTFNEENAMNMIEITLGLVP